MNEQFMNKMYELYLDMLQDTRADARIGVKYNTLVTSILNNVRLTYDNKDLMIKSDEKLMSVLQALEPINYKVALKNLQDSINNED